MRAAYVFKMRLLLDLIAPMHCLSCGDTSDGDLCPSCAEELEVIVPPICARCGAPRRRDGQCPCAGLQGFARARSLVAYAGASRPIALAMKRRGRLPLTRVVGVLLADLARAEGLYAQNRVVTHVPAGKRARQRGFDHADLIARAVASDLRVPRRRLLKRISEGPRQADVPLHARRHNARGRFSGRPATGLHVLLVDDVFTTGATAEACAVALLAAGAKSVDVLTWARTLRRNPRVAYSSG